MRASIGTPFFIDLFPGLLALFLLNLGVVAGEHMAAVRKAGRFLVGFALAAPLVLGGLGTAAGTLAGLSVGGAAVLGAMVASASYIAAPAAVSVALPTANPGPLPHRSARDHLPAQSHDRHPHLPPSRSMDDPLTKESTFGTKPSLPLKSTAASRSIYRPTWLGVDRLVDQSAGSIEPFGRFAHKQGDMILIGPLGPNATGEMMRVLRSSRRHNPARAGSRGWPEPVRNGGTRMSEQRASLEPAE